MEKNLKKNVSMCVTEYFVYAGNEYNIVNQLYFGLFVFFQGGGGQDCGNLRKKFVNCLFIIITRKSVK